MGKLLLMCSEIAFSSETQRVLTTLLKNRSIHFCLIKTKLAHNLASFLPRNPPILSEIFLILSEIVPILPLFHKLFSCSYFYLASLKALSHSITLLNDRSQVPPLLPDAAGQGPLKPLQLLCPHSSPSLTSSRSTICLSSQPP